NSLRVRLSVTVLAVLIVALAFLSFQTAERAQSILQPELERKAATVAGSPASLIGRALEVGSPLDRLEGLDAYLQRILSGNPDLSSIAVRDAGGAALYQAARDVAVDPPQTVSVPIAVQGGGQEVLVVGLDPAYAR